MEKRESGDRLVCPECGSSQIILWTEAMLISRGELESRESLRCQSCGHEFPRDATLS